MTTKSMLCAVEIEPSTVRAPVGFAFIAAIRLTMDGERGRWVLGDERFTDRDECEAHAIRVANGAALTFGKCRDWDRYEFAVVTTGTK